MAGSIAVAKRGKTFKVWGFDGFVNDETGEGEVIYYYGRCGLHMHQLTKRKVRGKWITIAEEARKKWHEKTSGEYTAVHAGEYWKLVEALHDGVDALIEKSRQD